MNNNNNNFQDQKTNLVPRPGLIYRSNLQNSSLAFHGNYSQPNRPMQAYQNQYNQSNQIPIPRFNPAQNRGYQQLSQTGYQMGNNVINKEPIQIERILGHRSDPATNIRQYCVKFKDKSYNDLAWLGAESLVSYQDLLNEYNRSHFESQNVPTFNTHFLIPERVLTIQGLKNHRQFLVKWTELDCSYSTWENEDKLIKLNKKYNPNHNLIEEYNQRITPTPKEKSNSQKSFYKPIIELSGPRKLTPDQIDAFNFLGNAWHRSQNILIADEEKVGIRISVCMFIKHILNMQETKKGPFLLITSQFLSTKWQTTLNEWTNIPYLLYIGSKSSLEIMKKYDFAKPSSTNDDLIFPLYITTLDTIANDNNTFSNCTWEYVIIDDTLQNKLIFDKTALNNLGSKITMKNRLILTPPLQNVDSHFVFAWFNFLDSSIFQDYDDFIEQHYKNGRIEFDDELINYSLTHYLYSDNKNLQITEIFVKCPITKIQQECIRSLYQNNIQYLSNTKNWKNDRKLQQIVIDMKKIISHPFLIKENNILQNIKKGTYGDSYSNLDDEMIFNRASGKMFILSLLLAKLKESNQRVVILCQMSETIELIQKMLNGHHYAYEKIDISTRGRSRFDAMMQFNDPSNKLFAFILDAKTGYYTMRADYVIIYESSWNPINDIFISSKILALNKKKIVYRLVTDESYETTFFENEPLLTNFDGSLISQSDIMKIDKFIRSGAYYAFQNTVDDFDVDIDQLLNENSKSLVYTTINNNSIHISLENPTVRNELSTPNFWKPLLKKSKEMESNEDSEEKSNTDEKDENSLYVVNLKKMQKSDQSDNDFEDEEEEFDESQFSNNEEDENGWVSKRVFQLINFVLHYGFLVDTISSILSISVDEIEKVISILIYYLTENTSSDFIIVKKYVMNKFIKENLNDKQLKSEMKNDDFTKRYGKEIDVIASNKTDWKLNRIEALLFINTSLKATELNHKVPVIPSSKDFPIESDFSLLNAVSKHGFPLIKLPKDINMTLKDANKRIMQVVNDMKTMFVDYCNELDVEMLLTPSILIEALKMPNLSEKRKIFNAIQKVGIDDLKQTFEMAQLPPEKNDAFVAYMEQFPKIADAILCHKKISESFFGGKLSRKFLQDTIFNVAILKYLRDPATELDDFSEEDGAIFEYLKANGFTNVNQNKIFIEKFGQDPEDSLSDFLQEYFKDKRRIIIKTFLENHQPQKEEKEISKNKDIPKKEITKFPPNYVLTDDDINEILPLKINDSLIITNLGKVVTDRPGFHNDRYLYMDGFTSEKYFTSVRSTSTKEWYVSRIIDTGGENPLFTVELKDKPSIRFEGNVPSRPWMLVLKAIYKSKTGSRRNERTIAISGPEHYGLSAPVVRELMTHMPGADQCEGFNKNGNKASRGPTSFKKLKRIDIASEYERQQLLSDTRSVVEKVKDDVRRKQRQKSKKKKEEKQKNIMKILKGRNKQAIYMISSSSSDTDTYDYYDSYSDNYSDVSEEEEEEDNSDYENETEKKPKEIKNDKELSKAQNKTEITSVNSKSKVPEKPKPVKMPAKVKPTKARSKVASKISSQLNKKLSQNLYYDALDKEREKSLDYFLNPDPSVLYIDHDVFAEFLRMKYNIQSGEDPIQYFANLKQDV